MARRASDKPVTTLRVVRGGYEPASDYDAEFHARLTLGALVNIEVVEPKSPRLLKRYWWTLGLVVENQERFPEPDDLHNWLLSRLGYYQEAIALMGGGLTVTPRGISDMDQQQLSRFVDRAFVAIGEEFGIDVAALQAASSRSTHIPEMRS